MEPLDPCVSFEEGHRYNQNHGLTHYIGPLVNLFCIKYNNAPPIGNYYKANEEKPTTQEVKDVTEDIY